MRHIILFAACLLPLPLNANNNTLNGALLGGVAGAIIGNNSGDGNGLRGAIIGTTAGALIGAASEKNHPNNSRHREPTHGYHPSYYRDHTTCSTPLYYSRPNYTHRGILLGGISGAIIGNNSSRFHHNAWRGAAYGAGAGWLLGTWADSRYNNRCYDNCEPAVRTDTRAETRTSEPTTQPAPAPQTIIINNYYNTTPMSSANSLFGR